MKNRLLTLLLGVLVFVGLQAQPAFVNLTPRPKSLSVQSGKLVLPSQFTVSTVGLDVLMKAEVDRFAAELTAVTNCEVTVAEDAAQALFEISLLPANSPLKESGYSLSVKEDKITLKAKSYLGLYYGLQTVKKVLPANVMAGVVDQKVKSYALPLITVNDEPRYDYRGFMLDVSRHFFTVEEVKRMLDVMAYYKMNRFHWHLSDDQGWRVEIKKYPRLTTVGATAPNSQFTDMDERSQYMINRPYGPYFYTQEQIKDVVAYARERHIEVIPEIDMPGHFVAAMVAYPEYSCSPDAGRSVWDHGGVSSDVLNVGNPEAVRFAKDILSELMELFPYEVIHIGGDECPTSAWENNDLCRQRVAELGLTSYRQLQSHFIKELAEFVAEKGHRLAVWNEAITANGSDLDIMKSTGADIYCWSPARAAAQKAKSLGLPNIYTVQGAYYINRRQGNSELDPPGAGPGTDDVRATYNEVPPAETDLGVQGTFWCEHVSDRDYLEWLALPRLIAVAEAGWTQQSGKNFADFQKRMSADTTLLNYGGYRYCKYHMLTDEGEGVTPEMVLPEVNSGANGHYYTLVSGATDDRAGRVIELVAEDSPLLTQFASNNVAVGRLWTNTPATEGTTQADYQAWCIEENPTTPGLYALVCKAKPEGSLTADPTETGTGGRWNYDNSGKHYHFVLGERAYGKKDGNYYYSIHSDLHTGIYLNSSKGGQGFSVNCYPDPTDGTAGQWCFVPLFGETETVEQPLLEQRHTYAIVNAVEGFEGITFAAEDGNTSLIHSDSKDAANAWEVTESTVNADGSQTVKLKNTIFSTYISSIGTYVQGYGRPVQTGESATAVKLVYNHATQAFRLKDDSNHSYYPATNGKVYAGANTAADVTYDASSRQGAEWNIIEVSPVTFKAQDSEGNSLGEFRRSIKADLDEVTLAECPELNNMKAVSLTKEDDKNYSVTYERTAYTLTLLGQDKTGAIVYKNEESVPLTESYTVKMPEVKYYEKVSADVADGEQLVLDEDRTIKFVYNTDALIGVKALGDFVTTQPEAGKSYVLLDDSDADGGKRRGYRKILLPSNRINRAVSVEEIGPSGVWTLEAADKGMKIKNSYTCLYVPDLIRSGATIASTEGGVFNFEQNTDGQTWCVKGLNGQMWDGTENGDLVGWNGGNGHPIRVFEFYSMPYYTVTYNCVDANNELLETRTKLLPAGSYYPLIIPFVQGMEIKAIEGNEDYQDCLEGFVTIKVVFQSIQEGIGVVESNRPSTDKHVIYDIQGRRLHTIKGPGLYIVGGRKVFVK